MRIGLIADTHVPAVGRHLPDQLERAFRGVDMILHAGDIVITRVLDSLSEIAPTYAARGNEDHYLIDDPRIKETHLFSIEGLTVGLTHYPVYEYDARLVFKEKVDVVVFGHTHEAEAIVVDGVFFVNPGSATNPYNVIRPGTVGILEIENARVTFKIIQL